MSQLQLLGKSRTTAAAGAIAMLLLGGGSVLAQSTGTVNGFYGSFATEVPVKVPKFHGLEPAVVLAYGSTGGNGQAGAGWGISGFSQIQRASVGGGVPAYNNTDIYYLDGAQLTPCASGSTSPSCTTGGNYSTEIESYSRITFNSSANTWTVTSKTGTVATYVATYVVSQGTFRWGISSVRDTRGNTVQYNWYCSGDCYPSTITYDGTTVTFYREARPDPITFGDGSILDSTTYRIKTIDVQVSGQRARAYKLTYTTSATTSRSLLTAVQEYGRDATLDSTGTVTGGTALPAMTFGWQAAPSTWNSPGDFDSYTTGYHVFRNGTSDHGNFDGDNWPTIRWGDVNGDGKTDACARTDDGVECYLSTGSGWAYSAGFDSSASGQHIFQNGSNQEGYGTFDGDNWQTFQLADVNGDGKADACIRMDYGLQCYLSTGSGWAYSSGYDSYATGQLIFQNGSNQEGYGSFDTDNWQTIGFPDVNGDGKADACIRMDYGIQCYLSTGSGWAYSSGYDSYATGQHIFRNGASDGGTFDGDNWPTVRWGDLNGDGKTDVCARMDMGVECYLSTGSGWSRPAGFNSYGTGQYIFQNGSNQEGHGTFDTDNWQTFALADVNGDGKADACIRMDFGLQCYLSTGGGWAYSSGYDSYYTGQLIFGNGSSSHGNFDGDNWPTIRWADVNGDGKVDACARLDNGLECYLSTSSGWVYSTGFDSYATGEDVFGNASNQEGYGSFDTDNWQTVAFADVNGDGIADPCIRMDYGLQCWPSTGAELITSVANGIGGQTTIDYTPSSAWSNTYLPEGLVLQTVSSVTTSDGRGTSSTTNYSYQGAQWSDSERRFFGFRYVKGVIDAAGDYTETYYHQGVGDSSKPDVTYYRDPTGNIFSYSTYTYTENTAAPYTSLLTQRWDYECDETTNCRRLLTQLGYDAYGNLTTAYEYGDYDVSGDERTTIHGFVPNTSAYIVGLPAYENVYQGIGTGGALLQQTLSEYDNSGSYQAAPTVGNQTKIRKWNSSTGGYVDRSLQYDAYGNPISSTDARSCTRTVTMDSTYHLYPVQTCNCLGQCSTQTWDAVLGQRTSDTGINGYTASISYDVLGRPTKKTEEDGSSTSFSYLYWGDPNNQRTRTTISDGTGLWQDEYQDGLGRTYLTCNRNGDCERKIYQDTSSRVWKTSLRYGPGENPVYVVNAYDGAGRLRTVTNPDGTQAQTVYSDGQGFSYTAAIDELGHEKVVWKDGLGHVTQVREQVGSTFYYTTYVSNALGALTKVVDAAGNVSTFTVDSLGRKTAQCDPDFGCVSYVYDPEGALTSRRDAKGQTINYAYDIFGRITSRSYPDGSRVTWAYDEAGHGASIGRPTTITDPTGTESVVYDAAGRTTQWTKCIGGICGTIKTGFDSAGRQSSITYPDGEVVSYGYDSNGNLASASNYVTSASYNSRGQLASIGYANGVSAVYNYDPNRQWLTSVNVGIFTTTTTCTTTSCPDGGTLASLDRPSIWDRLSNLVESPAYAMIGGGGSCTPTTTCTTSTSEPTTLFQASYSYDAAARVTSTSSSTNPLMDVSYTYDELNRLTGVSGAQSQTFTYDALGNMTSNSAVGAYSYGDPAHKHAVTGAGAKSYAYDANGNMTSGAGRTITWSYDDRPTAVTTNGVTATFSYDALGNRVKKVSPSGTTYYFGPKLELSPSGVWIKYITFGSMLVAKSDSVTGRYWYHQDRLGSTRLMTNASGQVANKYDFASFGGTLSSSGPVANSFQFQGHRLDAESGLLFMNARYYDGTLGRFISADSVVPDGSNPQALNRYAFVYNNPISNIDPTGHAPVAVAVIALASAIGTGSAVAITVAAVGAACMTAGYLVHSPLLMTIGSIALGFAGGWEGPLLGGGLMGGVLGGLVSAATSPLSPLDPGVKQAIGWAYGAANLIAGLTKGHSSDDGDAYPVGGGGDPSSSQLAASNAADAKKILRGLCGDNNENSCRIEEASEPILGGRAAHTFDLIFNKDGYTGYAFEVSGPGSDKVGGLFLHAWGGLHRLAPMSAKLTIEQLDRAADIAYSPVYGWGSGLYLENFDCHNLTAALARNFNVPFDFSWVKGGLSSLHYFGQFGTPSTGPSLVTIEYGWGW